MKHVVTAASAIALSLIACNSQGGGKAAASSALTNADDSLSYVMGQDVGSYVREIGAPINTEAFVRGARDRLEGKTAAISDTVAAKIKQEFAMKMQMDGQRKASEAGEKNVKAGDSALAANKARKEVTTTKTGLQIETIRKGTGARPTAASTVTVNYLGTLIDGKEFDNSYKRGQPATFPVSGVIPGWTEGLQLMNEGGKYRLMIPAALAYGERGAGQDIGPNSTLIFEVELLKVENK